MGDPSVHWEEVHAGKDPGGVSWWQDEDSVWVDLVERTGVDRHAHVVDIGSGSSTLPDALITRGFTDLTLVDLSPTALARTRERLRAHVPDLDARLRTIVADVLELELHHPAAVWFDRAVLHFLTEPDDIAVYAATLHASLAPGGCAVVATFASDGPGSAAAPVWSTTPTRCGAQCRGWEQCWSNDACIARRGGEQLFTRGVAEPGAPSRAARPAGGDVTTDRWGTRRVGATERETVTVRGITRSAEGGATVHASDHRCPEP
jgi:SAM-dependent methyltransferase